jgi:hypothetical protein
MDEPPRTLSSMAFHWEKCHGGKMLVPVGEADRANMVDAERIE